MDTEDLKDLTKGEEPGTIKPEKPKKQKILNDPKKTGVFFCTNCEKLLGSFNGTRVVANDGLMTTGSPRMIFFVCSACGRQVEVCLDNEKILLTSIKSPKVVT